MRKIRYTARFKSLPRVNVDHPLSGEWTDHRDCHIRRAPLRFLVDLAPEFVYNNTVTVSI